MESQVKRLPNEPIIIVTVRPHAKDSNEINEVAAAVDALIAPNETGPIYRINDFTGYNLEFGGLLTGMAAETNRTPGTLSDPRIQPVFVGTSDMVALGAHSARQEQYGSLTILLFATLDGALAHIRTVSKAA